MASIILRPRIVSKLKAIKSNGCGINRRSFSSETVSNPPKEAIISTQSTLSDAQPITPPPEAAPQVSERKSGGILKYGLLAAFTGITGLAGYATYAYTSDEIDEKTKAFRESVKFKDSKDASAVDKYRSFLYSAAMTVPAKSIELYLDVRRLVEDQVQGFTEPTSDKLLPDLHPTEQHVFTLVLDLNETLLYTDWKRDRGWRTFKRPGVDAFLEHLAKFYEIVVYSDQLNMYVDPVCDRLDPNHYIRYRLSRGATKYQDGKHYRDLSKLNRDPAKILYVSGHAFDSSLQPENCVPIKPYKLEAEDTALLDLIPFLEYVARNSPSDIRAVLKSYERKDVAKEFLERSKEYQRRMQEQRQQQRSFWRR